MIWQRTDLGQKATQTKRGIENAEAQAEAAAKAYAQQIKNDMNDSVNKFDKTVERKTAEAKQGISSWLGFGGSSK